jgi:hypothetical protein
VRENRIVTGSNGTAITVVPAAELPSSLRGALHRLFDETYAQADHGYLDKSLGLLRLTAVAAAGDASGRAAAGTSGREQVIGFALGETRIVDLPGLPGQQVGLAGLCCVHGAYRRRGLFRTLTTRVIAEGADAQEWKLFAGVDRDRGDSLLALSWVPDPPPGW